MTPVRGEAAVVDGVLGEKVRQLEERGEKWDDALRELVKTTADTDKRLANMEGQLTGALRSSKMLGGLFGFLISATLAAIGLLLKGG